MLPELVNGLFDFFIAIFTIITSPIQLFINAYIPDLNNLAQYLMPYFEYVEDWIPYIRDLSFVPQWAWQIIVSYFYFKLMIGLFSNVITLVAKWWATIVP